FLARQWQLGELVADNGGSPLSIEVAYRTLALGRAAPGAGSGKPGVPLQAEIEAVDHELDRRAPEGLAQPGALLDAEVDDERLLAPEPAWDASRLEYRV